MNRSNSKSQSKTYRFTGILIFSLILLGIIACIEYSNSTLLYSNEPGDNTVIEKTADTPLTIIVEIPGLPGTAKPLTLRLIEPGTFTMGSVKSCGKQRSWPSHKVTISRPFYIGVYEITQAQWEAVSGKPGHFKFSGSPDLPAEKVSWFDCQLWLRRLNNKSDNTFRFPTEAEWEYACKTGTGSPFFFTDNDSPDNMQFRKVANNYMWWQYNGNETHNVGLLHPNPWGLYDMHVNVWEWCADIWIKPHNRGHQTDPIVGNGKLWWLMPLRNRVVKGGSFMAETCECASSHRFYEQSIDYHYSM